jgi:hypothetical protein
MMCNSDNRNSSGSESSSEVADNATCKDKLSGTDDTALVVSPMSLLPTKSSRLLSPRKVYLPSKRTCLRQETQSSFLGSSIEITKHALIADATVFVMEDRSSITVSRHVLMEVPYFSAFFSKESERPSYDLPEDDPYAMRILMTILHHKSAQLPAAMSTKQLFDLATISNKYDVTDIISAHVECRAWICKLWYHDKPHNGEWGTWLWILYTFHATKLNRSRYTHVLEALAANMIHHKESDWWVLGTHEHRLQFSRIESARHVEKINGRETTDL